MLSKPKIWLTVSAITMIACLVVIITIKPIWGIDFVGGSLLEIKTADTTTQNLRQVILEETGLEPTIQTTAEKTFIIRTEQLSQDQKNNLTEILSEKEILEEEMRFESIGPTIGRDLRRKAAWAVLAAVAAMIIYLAWTFRAASGLISSWKFGVAAAVALIHDLLIVTALFVILSHTNTVSIDILFVSAMLAILGYSVNDTIVLFNRLKEKWLATRTGSLLEIMDQAAKATLIRSLNTSLTTLIVLITLLIFGGTTIRWFVVALAAGTIAGTYSSLFVAPPVLYLLTKK